LSTVKKWLGYNPGDFEHAPADLAFHLMLGASHHHKDDVGRTVTPG
jgi:hypothetical protein